MMAVVVSQIRSKSEAKTYTNLKEVGMPLWFAAPIVAAGYKFIDTPSVHWHVLSSRMTRSNSAVLCFNPSVKMMLAFLIPGVRRITLYQWRPIGHYNWIKRWIIFYLLKNADVILVYSYKHKRYLRKIFPEKRIKQIGLFIDTEYFSLGAARDSKAITFDVLEPFIFAPGDHMRDHDTMIEFAARLGVKLVITTRDKRNFDYLQSLCSPHIDVHFNVSFAQLRAFYSTCLFVLILSDSRLVPTGITTLSEALACSANIIVNEGNACSYAPGDHSPSITLVSSMPSVEELMVAADVVLSRGHDGIDERSLKRRYVETRLTLQSQKAEWQDALAVR